MSVPPGHQHDPFAYFDPRTFQRRAARFERLKIADLAPEAVYQELMFVIATQSASRSDYSAALPTSTYPYPAGTRFWRARALPASDHFVPSRTIATVADLWEPPAERVTGAGRLNKERESLLYTCLNDPLAAPEEIGVTDDEYFCLIRYTAIERLSLTGVGLPVDGPHPNTAFPERAQMIHEFFGRQFRRPASRTGSYTLAESVVKNNYDLPPDFHDGWLYESIAAPGTLNATFRPEVAHRKFRVDGALICKRSRETEAAQFVARCYTDGSSNGESFSWYGQGSDMQRHVFSEFGQEDI